MNTDSIYCLGKPWKRQNGRFFIADRIMNCKHWFSVIASREKKIMDKIKYKQTKPCDECSPELAEERSLKSAERQSPELAGGPVEGRAAGKMPEGWSVRKLVEFCDIVMGQSPPSSTYNLDKEGLPFFQGRRDFGEKYPQKMIWCSEPTRIANNGNVLLSVRAPVGDVNVAVEKCCIGRGLSALSMKNGNNDFLYYLIQNNRQRLKQIFESEGTVFGCVNKDGLRNFEVLLPDRELEQQAIAKILGDLDEKIELNHRMNKTLEAMGQTIFKEWFVDFRFPGYEKVKFINGLPEGWIEGILTDICDIVMGQSPPGESFNESGEGIVFYQGNRDFGFRFPTQRVCCTEPTRMAEAGDVLISVRAPVGALNITLEKCAIGRGLAALRMKHYSNGFIFYFLSSKKDLWDRFNSEGTVFGCLNKTEFQKVDLVIPSDVIMSQFDAVLKPIEGMILRNEEENRRLTEIRDSLLPKLMSGEMRCNYE